MLFSATAPFLDLALCPCLESDCFGRRCEQEAAGEAGEFEYGDGGRAATGAGDRAGDGGKDSEDAQGIWTVQKRGRFARYSRDWSEAPRKNAQILDHRQAADTAELHKEAGRRNRAGNKAFSFGEACDEF